MRQLLTILCLLILIPSKAQRLVKEFFPGKESCFINYMGKLDAGFVFASYTRDYGLEPWISDGTQSGTRMIKDIFQGSSGSMVTDYYFEADSIVYFIAQNDNQYGLWRTNGSATGTFILFDFGNNIPSKFYNEGIVYNGKLYFDNPGGQNNSLWSTDGTVAGTKKIYDFDDSGMQSRIAFNQWKGQLYLFATDKEHGTELWTSDGTTAGTRLLKDIFPGSVSSVENGRTKMSGNNQLLFFNAIQNTIEGYELFVTDGTESGTRLFKDFTPETYASSYPILIDGNDSFVLINANNKTWKSDGTLNNTIEIIKTKSDSLNYSYTYSAQPFKNGYLLQLYTAESGTELFICDKSFNQVQLIKDVNPGQSSSSTGQYFFKGDKVYCLAFNNMLGTDIWVTDGTFDNTIVYLELIGSIGNETLINWKNRLFFVGIMDNETGSELYEVMFSNSGIQKTLITSLGVFPNPSKSGSQVVINSSEDTEVILYNSNGQIVIQTTSSNGIIQLPELATGVYTLVSSAPGKISHCFLLIE